MIVAFANQKGGVGKSTAAVHMSYWLKQKGSALLVDSDAQQSSSAWSELLQLPYKIVNDPEELFDCLPALAQEYDTVVVDSPGGMSEVTKAILARCDIVLVPCQPSGLDLRSSSKILRFIRQAQELRGGMPKGFLFLSRATRGTVLLRESRQALSQSDIPLLKSTIYQRQCIADAPGQGLTVFNISGSTARDAIKDFQALFEETFSTTNVKAT